MQVKGACDAGISARGQRAAFNAVKKGVIKQGDEALFNKAGRLADGFGRDPFVPESGLEKHTVLRVINKNGETTHIWDPDINNLADFVDDTVILKQGSVLDEFGLDHIIDDHKNDFMTIYGIDIETSAGQTELINMIELTIEEGTKKDGFYFKSIPTSTDYISGGGKEFVTLRVPISDSIYSKGSITTAFPDTKFKL
jgi:hypothetical protein